MTKNTPHPFDIHAGMLLQAEGISLDTPGEQLTGEQKQLRQMALYLIFTAKELIQPIEQLLKEYKCTDAEQLKVYPNIRIETGKGHEQLLAEKPAIRINGLQAGAGFNFWANYIVTPQDRIYFSIFFSFKLRQQRLQDIDSFLSYHLYHSFKQQKKNYLRFVQLCLLEYPKLLTDTQRTVIEQWKEQLKESITKTASSGNGLTYEPAIEDEPTGYEQVTRKHIQTLVEEALADIRQVKEEAELLTTQMVCELFKVTPRTLINYERKGKLKPIGKSGKQKTYNRPDCEKVFLHTKNKKQLPVAGKQNRLPEKSS